jgi:DNA-binding transcriptional LysR family regulator
MMRRALLRQIAVFQAVASTGSIAAAAERIGKSAPAVHHDLKGLQKEVGGPLFDRVGRGLRLTPAAHLLYERLGRNLDEMERALERFARGRETDLVVRVAAVSGFARYRLAPALFAQAGAAAVELILGSHDQVIDALISERADVAITYRPVTAVPIVATSFASEDYVLIGPIEMDAPTDFAAVENLSFVTYDEYEYVFARWFDGRFGRQPRRLRRADHSSELEEALASVAAGRGVTITPADAWREGPWFGRCRQYFSDGPPVSNALYLLTMAGAAPDSAALLGQILTV